MNENAKRIVNEKLKTLEKSTFRTSFKLKKKELDYIDKVGLDKIREHAHDIIRKRLAPAIIENDGSQTPTKNHPVFVAEHATATCCRGCLEKWHHIKKGKELTQNEQNYVVEIIMAWITDKYKASK